MQEIFLNKKRNFRLFTEFFFVGIDSLLDNGNCFENALDLVDGGFLAFKGFIYGEKVFHFVKNVGGKLTDIFVGVVGGVVKGDGNDFVIGSAVVEHGNYADGITFNN